jgi:hypothetical protein
MLGFGERQRRRRRRNLLQRRRIASDLDHRPDQLAVVPAMIMRDVSKLWMNNDAASRARHCAIRRSYAIWASIRSI